MADDRFRIPMDVPVRFLAIRWSDGWDFDFPSMLLYPVARYFCTGRGLESCIEDSGIDIAINEDFAQGYRQGLSPGELKEFDWRGWDLERIRDTAERALRGEPVELTDCRVREEWLEFYSDQFGETSFRTVPKPIVLG